MDKDKAMEKIAERLVSQNPGIYDHEDAVNTIADVLYALDEAGFAVVEKLV